MNNRDIWSKIVMKRRAFLTIGLLTPFAPSLLLAQEMPPGPVGTAAQRYAGIHGEQFDIPAVDTSLLPPEYQRQVVRHPTSEQPGTIIVDTQNRILYLVGEEGMAVRYGVGIGRDGFSWSGRALIKMKREWPTWTPPSEMIARQPELEPYRNGMAPGLDNPLGARALYLFEGGRDTLYRIHGTADASSIGMAVSSGCVRLLNQDVIDLYTRVPINTPVVVV